jgi:hypothetical protein
MDKKVCKVLIEFIEDLNSADKDWKYNPDLVQQQIGTRLGVLKIFGKTKEEVISNLLSVVATLIMQPKADDEYPTINFIHGND